MSLELPTAEEPERTHSNDEKSSNLTGPVENASSGSIYGTFFIGGNEFAVSVTSIQEVVNEPEKFDSIPLSPDYLLGLFNLRGLIVPVVDLRAIFGLSTGSIIHDERKVAIIEHGEHCFGLLVDRTGDVFNARDIDHNAFSRVTDDIREAIVDGVFKLENGKRLVQVLDPFELLNLDKLPRVSGLQNSSLSKRKRGRRKQCISFQVGDCLCAFEMTRIKEIVELDSIDNDALAHGWTLGAIDLRGNTVPVVDFRVFLGKKEHTSAEEISGKGYKLIVMKLGENLISLLVDSINNIVSYFDDEVLSFPGVGLQRREMFKGCLSNEESGMVLLLDHELIINNEELEEVTRGHSKLYREDTGQSDSEVGEIGRKRTLITFNVGASFALDIENVNEVVEFPETIVRPPSMPNFVEGMVNLRGELIPIINLRALYHLDQVEASQSKLLIFSAQDKKYGIMVDAVNSIVNLSDHNSNVLPRLSDGDAGLDISNDVTEAILYKNGSAEDQSLMVLDLGMVVSRSVGARAA